MAKLIFLCVSALLLTSCASSAAPLSRPAFDAGFAGWLQQLEADALANGVSPDTVHAALDNAMPDERVVELDQKQPETTVTFDRYVHRVATPERVQAGRELLLAHGAELNQISRQFGVQPEVIVALWGIESSFGHDSGHYGIIDSLVTLAYEGRRADFFRGELIAALKVLDQEHITPEALRGSWAGAMGQCQFMPSTYLRYAVDYNLDGRRDIWTDSLDVWASIANYLAAEGWSGSTGWGHEVQLTQELSGTEIGLENKRSLAQWAAMGVRNAGGAALPASLMQASLIQPDGADGRSFLVYDNFRALMRWNRSTYFATTVGILADRIRG